MLFLFLMLLICIVIGLSDGGLGGVLTFLVFIGIVMSGGVGVWLVSLIITSIIGLATIPYYACCFIFLILKLLF